MAQSVVSGGKGNEVSVTLTAMVTEDKRGGWGGGDLGCEYAVEWGWRGEGRGRRRSGVGNGWREGGLACGDSRSLPLSVCDVVW